MLAASFVSITHRNQRNSTEKQCSYIKMYKKVHTIHTANSPEFVEHELFARSALLFSDVSMKLVDDIALSTVDICLCSSLPKRHGWICLHIATAWAPVPQDYWSQSTWLKDIDDIIWWQLKILKIANICGCYWSSQLPCGRVLRASWQVASWFQQLPTPTHCWMSHSSNFWSGNGVVHRMLTSTPE